MAGEYELDQIRKTFRGPQATLTFRKKKSLDLLLLLLDNLGKPVDKDELMDKVWGENSGADGLLTSAIQALRSELGDRSPFRIVVNVPGGGYRIGVPVDFIPAQQHPVYKGMTLPGREGWTVGDPLGREEICWVWYAQQREQDLHVVRFAEKQASIRALRKEAEVSDLLLKKFEGNTCFVRVVDTHFDQPPYCYIQREIAGQGLRAWLAERQKSGSFPDELALDIATQICDAVAKMHQHNLVHNDLRPANILVAPNGEGGRWLVKLTGFGHTVDVSDSDAGAGSAATGYALPNTFYRPPESLSGSSASKVADVYALGVLLFQLRLGDLTITPTGAWQNLIEGSMLRSDIESAVAQAPRSRLQSAREMTDRLHGIDKRQLRYDLVRLRRKLFYGLAAAVTAIVILLTILYFVLRARSEERNAAAVNAFLTEDLLRQSNPAYGKGIGETLHDAVESVRPRIDPRFHKQPRIAAKIHEEIAEALSNGVDVEDAGVEFDAAAQDWVKAEGKQSEEAVYSELQRAVLELKSQRQGSLDTARNILNREEPVITNMRHPSSRVRSSRFRAEGLLDLIIGNLIGAEQNSQGALDALRSDAKASIQSRLSAQAFLCYVEAHIGKADKAVDCLRSLIPQYVQLYGKESGPVLDLNISLAQALVLNDEFTETLLQVRSIYPDVVRTFGVDNQLTLAVLGMQAQAEEGLSHWNEAIADLLVIAGTAKQKDPMGILGVLGFSDLAIAECGQNRLRDGEDHARYAWRIASTPGQSPGVLAHAQYSLASCILTPDLSHTISPTRLDEAGRLLNAVDTKAAESVAAQPGWGANVELALAQLAFDRKQYCDAVRLLNLAEPAFEPTGADLQQHLLAKLLRQKLALLGVKC